MSDDDCFERIVESNGTAPPITFHFSQLACYASFEGLFLQVHVNARSEEINIQVSREDALLATVLVRVVPGATTIENVLNVGSALLWGFWVRKPSNSTGDKP